MKLPIILLFFLFAFSATAQSKVFMNRDDALKLAFPDADRIDKKEIILTQKQADEIESLSKSKLYTKLYVVYEGFKGDELLGYAIIDTHSLRTKTETVMFVINKDGTLRQAEILAFFEPPEYMPVKNWIELFYGKSIGDPLKPGKDIPNITGATITSTALAQTMRQILALARVVLTGNGTQGKKGE
ncbi:MAG TPA: FMN-binding protein [Thermodesulfobacteriota bacterium]|nr:FMN-binding protein [Thermodesulfobacteriota bacterium]